MTAIPADNQEQEKNPEILSQRWLELAVPLLSFGGALLAVIFWLTSSPLDFRISILGSVFASWILAYLAWIRPRKDIVALSTPIYSFIFIAVPTDISSSIILELLYAASLTVLLVRLRREFGRAGPTAHEMKELADPVRTYVETTSGTWAGTSSETGHSAAVIFVRFAEGNYGEAAQLAGTAAGRMEEQGGNPCLTRACKIVREHAALMNTSSPRPLTFLTFPAGDCGPLARPAPQAQDDDRKFYTALDNALLLLFSAAWTLSPQDRTHLLACQPFARKLFED